MADNTSAWGIEIGQAGLKAIRLRYAEAAGQVIAVAYDYVPHPKLLSQPDAVPDELIRQAMETFLSRNKVVNDRVAIALPGQSALAKFIQLPPVQANKVAEIVKYEARQQIPFPLEEVIWDYQPLGGGIEDSGFLLDSEVGLFAMKREQVEHHMRPFLDRKIEVDLVQIAPLALYNYLCYDRIGMRPGEEFEAGDEYSVLIDMGADTSTLIVSNGRKIWIRNVPVGGNHFTRALLKDMKLTFAKAEHLKCNATKAPDPRAVFQALRPVFNDYVSEIQKSIGFFASVNRQAKITKVMGVGNGFKLAGLQKFLQQNLQYEVDRIDHFQALVGDNVLTAPLFQDNLLTFPVPYGLALQALDRTPIHTTLLPPEIAIARKIRKKKPWAVAAAATLLFGMATSAAGYANVYNSVSKDRFGKAEAAAETVDAEVKKFKSAYSSAEGTNSSLRESGKKLVQGLATRENWLEIYKAIEECLPRDVGIQVEEDKLPLMNRISLRSITCKKYADVGSWFSNPAQVSEYAKQYLSPADKETPPSGPGYVFTLDGVHYHDDESDPVNGRGTGYVIATLLKNMSQWVIERVDPSSGETKRTDIGRMGISHAMIISSDTPTQIDFYPGGRPEDRGRGNFGAGPVPTRLGGRSPASPSGGHAGPGFGAAAPQSPASRGAFDPLDPRGSVKPIRVTRTRFIVQFAWRPIAPENRLAAPGGNVVDASAAGTAPADGTAPVTDLLPKAVPAVDGVPSRQTAVPTPAGPIPAGQPGIPAGQPGAATVPGQPLAPIPVGQPALAPGSPAAPAPPATP